MTKSTTNKPNWTVALGIPFLIFLSCFLISFFAKSDLKKQLLSDAILVDLLVTAPVIYFLAIRKSDVSKLSVARIFIAGVIAAGFIFNSRSNILLQNIKTWISPVIEGIIIFFIIRKFYAANKKIKNSNSSKIDFLMHCRSVMYKVIGNEKIANIFSSEIAVIYYAFFGSKYKLIDYKTKFSSYKENGLPLVLFSILLIFLIETTGMHFLLSLWSKPIAWSVTALSFYTCLQLFAHIRAIKARPIIINTDSLEIHNGLAGDAFIQFSNIEKIELSNKLPAGRSSTKISLLKGLENHNVIVYLKQTIQVTKIFGLKKRTDTVLFFVDRPEDFSINLKLQLTNIEL